MKANLNLHDVEHMGYGVFGRNLTGALERLGIENVGHLPAPGEAVDSPGSPPAKELARVALWASTPPHVKGWYDGQLAALFSMWEGTDMPPMFRENLPDFDRIFVPSRQNQELFGRFHPDVRYIPLAVDSRWVPTECPPVGREFIFLTGGASPRKNIPMVGRAFVEVFGDHIRGKIPGPIPRLLVKANHRDAISGSNIRAITATLSAKEELELYKSVHCFVSATKGEGWGLMPHQAIALGRPTILPNASGHAAFAHYGIPIDTHRVPAGNSTFWGDGGDYWMPEYDQLCQAMWDVYHNYEQYAEQAAKNAVMIGNEFSWERTAAEVITNLPELHEEGPTEWTWKPTKSRVFRCLVIREVTYTINGVHHRYEPGVEYWESPDMKMRLAERGHLDPDCIDPDEMGQEKADQMISAAARAICPTCCRPMNAELHQLVGAQ